MSIAAQIRTRLTSALTVGALVAAGMVATALVAPSAQAAPSPVVPLTAKTVTADALPTTQIDGVAWDQLVTGNTVYVGGKFNNARPAGAAPGTNLTPRANLLAYNLTTGALITSFAPSLNAQAKALALSPDGTRLYVGGSFTTANGATRYRLAAYNTATGALITTFAPYIDATVQAIAVTNTTVYVGGGFGRAGGADRFNLAAFNASNGALLTWNAKSNAQVNSMTLTTDGSKLIVGGAFSQINNSPAVGIAALDPTTGSLLPWNTTSVIRNSGTQAAILSLVAKGNSIYGTGYDFGTGNFEGTFKINAANGDIQWLEDCHGDTYDTWPGDGVVYSVSHAHYCGNIGGFPQTEPWAINMRHAMAFTDDATGTVGHDPMGYWDFFGNPSPSIVNWFPDLQPGSFTGQTQSAWTVSGNADYVVMGGEFPSVNGTAQQGLVRFATKPIAPSKIGPDYTGVKFLPSLVALPNGTIRVAFQANSDRDDYTLTYKVVRDSNVASPVYTTTASSTFWNRPTLGFIDTNVTPGQLYRYRLYATDSAGNTAIGDIVNVTAAAAGSASPYATKVLADGASPYWPMSETSGTVLFDNSGFNDADTGAGVTRNVAGAIAGNTATTFNGSTSGATRTAIPGPNTFTAQAWIKTTSTTGGKILGFAGSQTGNSGSYDRHIYMDNEGRIFFGVYPNGVATLNTVAGFNDGQWHMISASLGADGMKLYVDDKLVGQRADVTWGQDYQGFWRVGGDNIGGWPNQPSNNYFTGAIDEVAIYPTVLSRQAVDAQWVASGRVSTLPTAPADAYGAAVFNDNPLLFWRLGETTGTTAVDSGPNADQSGLYQNGVTQGAVGGIKGTTNTAALFDGQDDLVASANSYNNPQNYSEEAWFKTTTTAGGKIIGFGGSQNGTSGAYDRHVYMNNDGTVTFGVWTGATNVISTSNPLNDGQWHHIVATQSSTTGMAFYVDGILVGTNPQTGAQDYSGFWRVGGDNHWGCCSPFISATIDDVAIYNSVLNQAQVSNHFSLGSTVEPPNQNPVASFTSAATFLDATFNGSASSDPDGTISSYEWNFGDGATGTGATPTHPYAVAGTFNVTLKVTDNKGGTNQVTQPITVAAAPVNQPPVASFTNVKTNLKVDVDATASSDPEGPIASYAWNFGDTGTATGATASHVYAAAGTYSITLTVTDGAGLTGTTTTQVTVAPAPNVPPVAAFTINPVQLTGNFDATNSSDSDGTIAGYAWNYGDGTTGTGKTSAHPYAAAGTYQVTLTVTDNGGATHSVTQPITVTAPPVNVPPTVNFTKTANGLTVNVESTSTDTDGTIVSYAWTFGDGGTSSDAAAVHPYAAAGTYPITLTVTDNSGASVSQTQSITVAPVVPVNVAPVAAFTFTTNALQASVNGAGSTDSDGTIANYSWDFGDGGTDLVTTPAANHTYLAAGTYPVTLTVTDNNGATGTNTQQITVTAPATPVPLVNDAFGRVVSNGFGTADVGGAWTGTGASFSVTGGVGNIRMATPGSGPIATLGAVQSLNVELTADVQLDKAATGGGTLVSYSVRKVGNSEYRTSLLFIAGGRLQVSVVKISGGVSTTVASTTLSTFNYAANEVVHVKFRVSGTTSVALSSKVWKGAAAEPAAWSVAGTDASATLTTPGAVALVPYLSGTATAGAVVATFDNLKVVPLA